VSDSASQIVILGHTGFIGNALLAHFCTNGDIPIRGFDSSSLDLTQPAALAALAAILDSQTILVFAAAHTLDRAADSLDIFDANMAMVLNVARVLTMQPVRKCVYFSTMSVYGDRTSNLALREDTPVAPTTYYAAAKYAGECILQQVAHAADLPLLVLRPCRVEGPGVCYANYGPVYFLRSILSDGTVWLYGDGRERRDHLYIHDLVRIVAHLVCGDYTGVYNLASGQSYSYLEILAYLQGVVPQEFTVHYRPRTRPLIHQQCDISKLLRAMPHCQFTSLTERIQATYDYYASRQHAAD
jgi:UDP-glucose 4-epimerase